MSDPKRAIWKFAVEHPDYWRLLRTDEDTPELAALDADERAAFQAARRVAQDRAERLLRAVWDEGRSRSTGTSLHGPLEKSPQRGTVLVNKMGVDLPKNLGILYFALWSAKGVLSMWASLHVAQKRVSEARRVWGADEYVHLDGRKLDVFCPVAWDASDSDNARAFADRWWPRIETWLQSGGRGATPPSDAGP